VRHPSTAKGFEWDDANEDKLAERGIKGREVEGVWGNKPRYRRNKNLLTANGSCRVQTRSQERG
jgi:hypothetical protein